MTTQPLVSVAIPCYNHEKYVQECIQSVIDQDYENIELIIIDDGSSDNSVEKIKEMIPACEKRFVRFSFRERPNNGLSTTLNEAIEWCEGVYFSAIASDDVMYPAKTSTLLKHIANDDLAAGIFCGCDLLNSKGEVIGSTKTSNRIFTFSEILRRAHQIITPCQLLRMERVKLVGCYVNGMHYEDWYMWLKPTEKGHHLRVTDDLLVGYRQLSNSMTKNPIKMFEGRKEVMSHFRSYKDYNRTMAHICLAASLDFTSISKIAAAKLLFEGIGYNKGIMFSRWGGKCFLRLFIPRYMILWAKKRNSESPVNV